MKFFNILKKSNFKFTNPKNTDVLIFDDESSDTIINMINITCLTNAIREIVAVEHVDTPASLG